MDIKTAVLHYWPYWLMGIMMIFFTLRSEEDRDLMRIQPKFLLSFVRTMCLVTLFRCIMFHFSPPTLHSAGPILQIPLWLTATVFWEDAVHILPLIIMTRFLGDSKLSKVILFMMTLMVQISFGLGHVYQSIPAAIMISFYIPIVKKLAIKHGVGTVMCSHMMYDFITLLTVRLFLGL